MDNQHDTNLPFSLYSKLIQNVNQVGDLFLDYIVGAQKKTSTEKKVSLIMVPLTRAQNFLRRAVGFKP